jgi:hypothetical protein
MVVQAWRAVQWHINGESYRSDQGNIKGSYRIKGFQFKAAILMKTSIWATTGLHLGAEGSQWLD